MYTSMFSYSFMKFDTSLDHIVLDCISSRATFALAEAPPSLFEAYNDYKGTSTIGCFVCVLAQYGNEITLELVD